MKVAGATDIPEGTPVLVDGDTGQVHINPSGELVERLQAALRAGATLALADSKGPGMTKDGKRVALLANIGGVEDAIAAGQPTSRASASSAPSLSS